jgi:hypothetical protein
VAGRTQCGAIAVEPQRAGIGLQVLRRSRLGAPLVRPGDDAVGLADGGRNLLGDVVLDREEATNAQIVVIGL